MDVERWDENACIISVRLANVYLMIIKVYRLYQLVLNVPHNRMIWWRV